MEDAAYEECDSLPISVVFSPKNISTEVQTKGSDTSEVKQRVYDESDSLPISTIIAKKDSVVGVEMRRIDNSEEEEVVCDQCASMPCEWIQYGTTTVEQINSRYQLNEDGEREDTSGVPLTNALLRKSAYKIFTYFKFGHLGHGHRIPIPTCVIGKIREEYPEENGE